jgi:hypothetical protein
MHAAPSSLASRGDVVLQPIYFTSSTYVRAFRDDLSTLILRYYETYSQAGPRKPFALFKAVWMTMGWHWLHFKVFDSRSRQTFLEVTIRLCLGEIALIWTDSGLICNRKDGEDRSTLHQGRVLIRSLCFLLYPSQECHPFSPAACKCSDYLW